MRDGAYYSQRATWDGITVADWARDLSPLTAARLASAARMSRTREDGASNLERSAKLAAVGIPAMSA
jgi:hypothetical protein